MELGESAGQGFQISHQEGKRYIGEVSHPAQITEAIQQFSNVKATSQVLTGSAQALFSGQTRPVQVYGIELDAHLAVSDFGNQIRRGSLVGFRKSLGQCSS